MPSEPALRGYRISAWLFVRLLGLVYLIAFLSFLVQARGLIGPDGILPLSRFLHAVAYQLPSSKLWALPTLSWLNPDQPPVGSLAVGGIVLSILLVLGLAPLPCLILLWMLYLSLVSDGQDFMAFQWDNLLLETGFAAILLAPLTLRSSLNSDPEPPRPARWLLYGVLFRLILGSGVVKLSGGDPHWRDLSALTYHYWTQPLPLWTSWYANRLPFWFQRASCLILFGIELGAPFLIIPPATRKAAFAAILGLMLLIAGTGNYCFFNLLTAVLCLLLLDDRTWPLGLRSRLAPTQPPPGGLRSALPWFAAALLGLLSLVPFLGQLGIQPAWPGWLLNLEDTAAPLRSVNTYGLFAEMTTSRHEIILEGSDNGVDWKEYGFRWKPGDPFRRPRLAAPYQPRLDWQLWFAALGRREDNPWFDNLCVQMLRGSPDVLALLSFNPFPDHPPRYLRARLYDYQFADAFSHHATGAWWRRTLIGDYCPVVSLAEVQAQP
jgi:lipase maturation factor 1